MDPPDSTESVLNLSFGSEIFGHEPKVQSEVNDSFLDDIFLTDVHSENQHQSKESIVVTDQLEIDTDSDKNIKSSPESPDQILSVDEAIMDKLKQQNKELKEQMLKQERELAKYEVDLSEKMSCLLEVQMERDSLNENLRISDSQRSSLQLKLEEKEAELKQFKELVQKQVSEEEEVQQLKKQTLIDAKLLKKTKRELQVNTELLNKNRESVRVLKKRNRKLISIVLEFGAVLEQKELLSKKKKKNLEIVKTWVGDLSETYMETIDSSSLSDEENEKSNNLVDKIITDIEIKEENSSQSNESCLTSTTNAESFSNGFVHSIKSSPFYSVEDNGFVDSTKIHRYAPSPLAAGNKAVSHINVSCKTEGVFQDKTNRVSPDSNFHSLTLRTESLCSEDIEISDDSFAEIKEGIKGWVLRSENFHPISPLPPSPSPKGSIRVIHKNFIHKSEKDENFKKCSLISSVSDTPPELIQQEDIQFPQNSNNLKAKSKTSDQSGSLCNVSSIKSKVPTTSSEPNSEILTCENEFSQSSLLKESKMSDSSSNNSLSTPSNIEQEMSPASLEPSAESVEKKVFLPAHSSSLNEEDKTEDTPSPLSPVFSAKMPTTPPSPKLSSEFHETNNISKQNSAILSCENIDNHSSSPEKTSFSKNCSPEQSPICIKRKTIFSHQDSGGFEPHLNELAEKRDSVPNKSFETSTSSSEIPPELHYVSSTYLESNKFKILHQGNSVYDYLVNPETKLSVCVLTVPSKSTSSNQLNAGADSVKLFPNEEERKKRVLSVYQATERRLSLINHQVLNANSPRENLNNSLSESSSHIYVVVENESKGSLNCSGDTSLLQDVSDSGMDLEYTSPEDMHLKDNSSVNNKPLADENQSFVSSSCDISTPTKRKLQSSSLKYSDSQNDFSINLSPGHMNNFNSKSEANSVSGFTAKKKRLSHINNKLPSKKLKIEAPLSSKPENQKLNIVNSDSVEFSSKISKDSPLTSEVQLQNSVTTTSLVSDDSKCEELKSRAQMLTSYSVTQLTPKKSVSSINLTSDAVNLNLLVKDSSKKSLLNSDNSLVERKNSPAKLPQLPFLDEVNKIVSNINSVQKRLNNSSPEKPSSPDLKLLTPPSELKNSAKDQPVFDSDNPLLEMEDSPSKKSTTEINYTLLENKTYPRHHLLEHSSPSKEIPSCNFNEAQLDRSPSINLTALDCENSLTPKKLVSNLVGPKVKCKRTSPKNKSKTNAKNSKFKKLPKCKLVSKARNRHQINKVPSCEPESSVSITPSELKGSVNDQPLCDTNNALLKIKDSPSKQSVTKIDKTLCLSNNTDLGEQINIPSDKSVSPVCNPELLSKNVENCQLIPGEHNFQLDDQSSPSRNQTQLPVNNTKIELPNSQKKDSLESCTKYQMLDQTNLPSEIEIKSQINDFQSEFKEISSPTNSYVSSISSSVLYLEENALVIDEQISVEEDMENDSKEQIFSDFEMETQEVSMINDSDEKLVIEKTFEDDKVIKNSKKKNKKKKDKTPKSKKKNKALQAKKKNLKSVKEEQSLCPILSIPRVLDQIDEVKILDSLNESHFKLHAHTLLSALINPSNASCTASVLFQIFNHLISSRTNPLMSFPFKYDSSVFFPLTERCIVTALIQADKKRKNHLKGLKTAAINNLFLLILSKSSISKTGLGAFCRVFTELCKNSEEKRKPVKLCCELIKTKHKFAPILIASVMGVWPELFSFGGKVPEEEIILQSSLAFGLQKKPSSLNSSDWKQCKAVFSKYLLSSPVIDVDETAKNLTEILEEFLDETMEEKDYLLTDPLLIFATCKGWNWADENLSCFILSSLAKYTYRKEDERAFSLFCNLYADVSLLSPDFESCSEILEQLFSLKEAFEYVKGCAARSMIKLYLLSKHKFPLYLVEWTRENESKLVGTQTEVLLKQCCISDDSSFTESDIIAL